MRRFAYSAYGLTIDSDIALPGLDAAPQKARFDVRVRVRSFDKNRLNRLMSSASVFDRPGCTVRVSTATTWYSWHDIGSALIRGGRDVVIDTAAGIDVAEMAPFVTGAILGNLLHQRGFMVLHGSAVLIGRKGIAFLGEKGAGKSTIALHLHKLGYSLLTDDLIPIEISGGEVWTNPGFPQVKLWNDTLTFEGMEPASLPQINRFVPKRAVGCTEGFPGERNRLWRIYILSEDNEVRLQRLDPSQAFIELARNNYMYKYLGATGRTAEHFRTCTAVVNEVPIYRLGRPRDFELMPEVASAVVEHI